MDPMNEREFRRRITALSGEEVSIALEIMLALHPNRYLNTLAQGYITMKSDNDRIKDVVDSRNNYIRIITGEIDDPANFERFMNPPEERKDEELEEGVINALDPINDMVNKALNNPVNLKVPDFLK